MRGLSFDPGASCGFVVADHVSPGSRATLVACGVLDHGTDSERIAEAFALLTKYAPDVIFVESVHFVVPRAGFGSDMAGHLVRAAKLGGRLMQLAMDHGFAAEEVSAEEWRKCMVGTATPENAEIAPVILMRFSNWPQRSNNHERDAGGLCLYGLERALRLSLGVAPMMLITKKKEPKRKPKRVDLARVAASVAESTREALSRGAWPFTHGPKRKTRSRKGGN